MHTRQEASTKSLSQSLTQENRELSKTGAIMPDES